MAWLPGIPNANDQLKNSQSQLKDNFTEIDTSFSVNHEPIGSGADQGKHKFTTLTLQTSDPSKTSGEIVLFNKVASAGSGFFEVKELWVRKTSSGNKQFIPLTAGIDTINSNFQTSSGSTNVYNIFGSGLIMKHGYIPLSSLGGALSNDEQRSTSISLTGNGPDFLTNAPLGSAQVTLCPQGVLSFGANNTMVYIRYGSCTSTSLAIQIVNQTGSTLPANTRICYNVIGQVDLTNT